jgi:hypothetical protein
MRYTGRMNIFSKFSALLVAALIGGLFTASPATAKREVAWPKVSVSEMGKQPCRKDSSWRQCR